VGEKVVVMGEKVVMMGDNGVVSEELLEERVCKGVVREYSEEGSDVSVIVAKGGIKELNRGK
jgi:hypothetical protein